MCNTSGFGKTRELLEGLTKYWGFYFVTAQDVRKVSVFDMMNNALDSMPTYEGWTQNLKSVPIENREACELLNRNTASGVLQKVFAARTVVFELFLQLCKELDGGLKDKHKFMWF